MFTLKVDHEIELGLLEERHAQLMFELNDASRAFLREWLPIISNLKTVEENRAFIRAALKRLSENNGFQAGIWFRGELAGGIGFRFYDWNTRTTEIGYWLGQPFTGHGIITRAARKMVDYAVNDLGLNRVEIRCATGNTASRAVAERLGFKLEGVLRQNFRLYDDLVDVAVYSVLAEDWKGRI